ncbi:MAG TPA: hypothetical protein VKE71_16765, partial [Candidatus Angelobacter sp.]|nr:hypothetical protein [Candidatus Angelobacter sp.]
HQAASRTEGSAPLPFLRPQAEPTFFTVVLTIESVEFPESARLKRLAVQPESDRREAVSFCLLPVTVASSFLFWLAARG